MDLSAALEIAAAGLEREGDGNSVGEIRFDVVLEEGEGLGVAVPVDAGAERDVEGGGVWVRHLVEQVVGMVTAEGFQPLIQGVEEGFGG